MREGARLCAGLGSAPRIQQGEREMGVLCLAALCPSQFGRAVGVWLSLGAFLHLDLLCCSPAAHVLLCPAAMAVLPSITCCCGTCSHSPHVAAVNGTWGAEQGDPPVPAALTRAGTLPLLSYRPCAQPIAKAKELHMRPGLSASSPSHQLLGARTVAVTPSSAQFHPLPAAHSQV